MFEWIRKLTAGYTEEEYREWLYEDYLADIPKGKNEFTIPTVTENYSFKDIACLLEEVAEETGYDSQFLCDMVSECMEDGQSATEAFAYVAGVSYEQDW